MFLFHYGDLDKEKKKDGGKQQESNWIFTALLFDQSSRDELNRDSRTFLRLQT
jgi:hypothetical protein